MKIFAIQKAQVNTSASKFNQNNTTNQNPVMKTNHSGDKFEHKNVSFGMATVVDLRAKVTKLSDKLKDKKLPKTVRQEIEDEIEYLGIQISQRTPHEGGATDPAGMAIESYNGN